MLSGKGFTQADKGATAMNWKGWRVIRASVGASSPKGGETNRPCKQLWKNI